MPVSAPVPYRRPRRMNTWEIPSDPEVFCGKEKPHTAHAWDEVHPEDAVVRWDPNTETVPQTIRLISHWCKGFGHLKGCV